MTKAVRSIKRHCAEQKQSRVYLNNSHNTCHFCCVALCVRLHVSAFFILSDVWHRFSAHLSVQLFIRPSVHWSSARPSCLSHALFCCCLSCALFLPALPRLPDPLCPVPRRPRQLEPRAPRLFASAPPMLPDPPPPPHIPCVCPPCVGGTCKFLKIMCVVKRALLYSPPAETRLTVYRRFDILVQGT